MVHPPPVLFGDISEPQLSVSVNITVTLAGTTTPAVLSVSASHARADIASAAQCVSTAWETGRDADTGAGAGAGVVAESKQASTAAEVVRKMFIPTPYTRVYVDTREPLPAMLTGAQPRATLY